MNGWHQPIYLHFPFDLFQIAAVVMPGLFYGFFSDGDLIMIHVDIFSYIFILVKSNVAIQRHV